MLPIVVAVIATTCRDQPRDTDRHRLEQHHRSVDSPIVNFAKELTKRRVPAHAVQNILALEKQGHYTRAIELCVDYTFGKFEDDRELLLSLKCCCHRMWLSTQPSRHQDKDGLSLLYFHLDRHLHEYLMYVLPQQQQGMNMWKKDALQESDKILTIQCHEPQQEEERMVQSLYQHFKLKFVPKNTVIYEKDTIATAVYFVAIGSVGLYPCSNEFFPFDVKRSGSMFGDYRRVGLFGFGEVARANTDCFLYEIETDVFGSILDDYPELCSMITADIKREKQDWRKYRFAPFSCTL